MALMDADHDSGDLEDSHDGVGEVDDSTARSIA